MKDHLSAKKKGLIKRNIVKGTQERTSYGLHRQWRLISPAHFTRSRNVVGSVAVNASAFPCLFPSPSADSRWLPSVNPEIEVFKGGTPSSPRALPLRLLHVLCGMSTRGMRGMTGSSEGGSDDSG